MLNSEEIWKLVAENYTAERDHFSLPALLVDPLVEDFFLAAPAPD